jgi:hypothetical protein
VAQRTLWLLRGVLKKRSPQSEFLSNLPKDVLPGVAFDSAAERASDKTPYASEAASYAAHPRLKFLPLSSMSVDGAYKPISISPPGVESLGAPTVIFVPSGLIKVHWNLKRPAL